MRARPALQGEDPCPVRRAAVRPDRAGRPLPVIVSIIIMTLRLGYAVANSRGDRIDMVKQQAEGHLGLVPRFADQPH